MIRGSLLLAVLTLISIDVYCGTIVDFRDQSGRNGQFLSDGKMGRLNTGNGKTYMIVDYASRSMKVVMVQQQQVLDLGDAISAPDPSGPAADKPVLTFEAEGDGPVVAGYPTKQYKLLVNGEFCGQIFGSTQALEDSGLDRMFNVLRTVAARSSRAVAGVSACKRGKINLFDQFASIGAPLRTLDEKGQAETEVTGIQTGAKLAPDTFVIPREFKVVSAEQMKQAEAQLRAGLQKMQENMPEMERKLAEMQKNGKVSPETVEKLKQLMKQYQSNP